MLILKFKFMLFFQLAFSPPVSPPGAALFTLLCPLYTNYRPVSAPGVSIHSYCLTSPSCVLLISHWSTNNCLSPLWRLAFFWLPSSLQFFLSVLLILVCSTWILRKSYVSVTLPELCSERSCSALSGCDICTRNIKYTIKPRKVLGKSTRQVFYLFFYSNFLSKRKHPGCKLLLITHRQQCFTLDLSQRSRVLVPRLLAGGPTSGSFQGQG